MPENSASGPQVGQRVIWWDGTGVIRFADIQAVSNLGIATVIVYPASGTTITSVAGATYDPSQTKTNSWSYPSAISGI